MARPRFSLTVFGMTAHTNATNCWPRLRRRRVKGQAGYGIAQAALNEEGYATNIRDRDAGRCEANAVRRGGKGCELGDCLQYRCGRCWWPLGGLLAAGWRAYR